MYPYQKEEMVGKFNPLSEIQIPVFRKWRWLQSLSGDSLLFASVSVKMNRRKFWDCIDATCEKFQKLPQHYLNTNEEDWNFYTLTFVIEVSTANGAFIRMVAMPTVELIDEPTEIITTVHLCPPPPQKIALTQRYLDFKNLYTKINN